MTQLLSLFDPLEEIGEDDVLKALGDLERDYAGREIELKEVAGGWRVQTGGAAAERLAKLERFRPPRFSRALLESLAAIAYRQPITRAEIEELRGVRLSGHIMRTLMERNWIEVVGHRETPGRPALYGTTKDFMDYFGIKRLDDLPSAGEFASPDDAPAAGPPGAVLPKPPTAWESRARASSTSAPIPAKHPPPPIDPGPEVSGGGRSGLPPRSGGLDRGGAAQRQWAAGGARTQG